MSTLRMEWQDRRACVLCGGVLEHHPTCPRYEPPIIHLDPVVDKLAREVENLKREIADLMVRLAVLEGEDLS